MHEHIWISGREKYRAIVIKDNTDFEKQGERFYQKEEKIMFNNSGLGWKIGMGIGAAILGGSAFGAGVSSFRNSRIPGGG